MHWCGKGKQHKGLDPERAKVDVRISSVDLF